MSKDSRSPQQSGTSERPYHDGDPARALRRAIEITDGATMLA